MTDWLPTNTVRLARLAHPGTDWAVVASHTAVQIPRDGEVKPRGGIPRYFNANSLDDLARAEARICGAGFQREYGEAINATNCTDHGLDISSPAGSYYLLAALVRTPADQRRRAILAVLEQRPEIEEALDD